MEEKNMHRSLIDQDPKENALHFIVYRNNFSRRAN